MANFLGRLQKGGFPEFILEGAFTGGDLAHFLEKQRFPLSGVCYDASSKKLQFYTDRLGFSPLYLYQKNGNIAWSNRLSALFELKELEFTLNPDALEAFLQCGYLPGDMTWFAEVLVLPAASIWEYDMTMQSWEKARYWTWADIPQSDYSFEEAVDELAVRLRDMMQESLSAKTGTIGVSLSGGLDSRLLLALAGEQKTVVSYTFGRADSWDVQIAAKVAKQAGISHRILLLEPKNWMDHREEAIWRSDGMASYMHLHHVPNYLENAQLSDWNLNGCCGDALFKGFGNMKASSVSMPEAHAVLGRFADQFPPNDPFYGNRQSDAYWLDQHVRNCTLAAVREWNQSLAQLTPFLDFRLIEFLYGLPVDYRLRNHLYSAMLLKHFPKLFKSIPWKLTGIPLHKTRLTEWALLLKVPQIIRRSGLVGNYQYTDYGSWMRQETALLRWNKLLDSSDSEVLKTFAPNLKSTYLDPMLRKKRGGEEGLSRALTIAIWLRHLEARGVL